MAEFVLPSSVDFSKRLPALPNGVSSQLLSIQSTNGQIFVPSSTIQFDLPARQDLYLDGKTMFIRYKISYTVGAATTSFVRRKPALTTFQKLDEFIGSTPINSVYNYHQVANTWVDQNMSVADIYGQQAAFGITAGAPPSLADFDGFALTTANATTDLFLATPVVCSAISSADHLIPTGLMAPMRLQFVVASIVDQIYNAAISPGNVTAITVSNPELCIQAIDMPGVDAMVANAAPKLYIKTNGWANSSTSVGTSAGFQSLIFNHRYESLESLTFLSSSNDTTKGVNAWGDSFDLTGANGGTYQIQIGQTLVPLVPINTSIGGGKAAVLMYMREANGSIQDQRNSPSINSVEFSRLASGSTISSIQEPAKFQVTVPLEKIQSSNPYQAVTLLSGVSAASAPINVLVNIGTAPFTSMTCFLIAKYTELIEIDPMTRQVQIVQ